MTYVSWKLALWPESFEVTKGACVIVRAVDAKGKWLIYDTESV